jgi:hypothetical protein
LVTQNEAKQSVGLVLYSNHALYIDDTKGRTPYNVGDRVEIGYLKKKKIKDTYLYSFQNITEYEAFEIALYFQNEEQLKI